MVESQSIYMYVRYDFINVVQDGIQIDDGHDHDGQFVVEVVKTPPLLQYKQAKE
jgi:hypothetical protein